MTVGLDHLVLCVADVERSVAWYGSEFGLAAERLDAWRADEVPFVSLRIDATTLVDLLEVDVDAAADRAPNVDHLAFVVDGEAFDAAVERHAGRFEMGPSMLFGAQGRGAGFYVRDPDGHRVEFRTYDRSV